MVRSSFVDKNGLRKGAWSDEEDEKLKAYILKYGHWNWRLLPKYAGLARCGKSCRLRWMNYLKPGLKRGDFSREEVDIIMKMHQKLGNKWSTIAAKLPGRTDNEIKNYWHVNIRRLPERNSLISPSEEKEEKSTETCPQSIQSQTSDDDSDRKLYYSSNIKHMNIDLNLSIDFPADW